MSNKYYQDELTYLRAMGREFSEAHPQLAPMLAETGTDPDVERLLEGCAFLTGRIRQRLDGELPELTHALVGLLWPHYLRSIPAMSILEFTPSATLQDTQVIPRGTLVESSPIEGTACRFRTTSDVRLYPFGLDSVILDHPLSASSTLTLTFAFGEQVDLSGLDFGPLRLHLHGEPQLVGLLYLWLCRHVSDVEITAGGQTVTLPADAIAPVGFDDSESLLPYPPDALSGYRLLQEFFALPERYFFVEFSELHQLASFPAAHEFSLTIRFADRPPDTLRVNTDMIRLGCTPVVNLHSLRSAPVTVDHEKTEYRLRADAPNPSHYEIFSVDRVVGWEKGTLKEREYRPFYSYEHIPGSGGQSGEYYQLRLRPSSIGVGTDTYITFAGDVEAGIMPPTETIAADLTCTNRNLPTKLNAGDISQPTSQSPSFASFRNISRVTPSVPPPIEGRLLWHLIAQMSLNYTSLASADSLRALLGVYNFAALVDRQAARAHQTRLEGIESVRAQPGDHIHHGAVYRGISIDLSLKEGHFAGEGEMFLFASVLNRFFGLYASLNAFTRLTVRGVEQGTVYEWPAMLGSQSLA